jgi:hypothetical protein
MTATAPLATARFHRSRDLVDARPSVAARSESTQTTAKNPVGAAEHEVAALLHRHGRRSHATA